MRPRLVQRVTRLQIPGILHRLGDRRNRGGCVVNRQSPRRAHESGTIHAGDIGSRRIARADVSGHGAGFDAKAEIRKRPMTAPAIGHAADLLIDLALQIPGAANPIEAGAGSVRIGTVICRRQLPLHPLESKRGFDGLLAIGRPHRRDGVELAIKLSLKQIPGRGPRLAKVDHRGIAKRAETDAYNFDVVGFGAQKVNVAIARNCHETSG